MRHSRFGSFKGPDLRAVVAVLGIAITLIFWQALRRQERDHINRLTDLAARAVRSDLLADTNDRLDDIARLAQFWELQAPPKNWNEVAQPVLLHLEGCISLEYVDRNYHVRQIVSENGDTGDLGLNLVSDPELAARLDLARITHETAVTPLQTLPTGLHLRQIAVPIYQNSSFQGFVLAKLDSERSLRSMLKDVTNLGYSIVITDNGQMVFRDLDPNSNEAEAWRETVQLDIGGVSWKILVAPVAETLPLLRTKLPQLTLFLGLAITTMLALVLHFAQKARIYARKISLANEDLKAEVEARRESEARFAGVLEMSSDAIVSMDEGQRITSFNRGAENIFGYKAAEVLGADLSILLPDRFSGSRSREIVGFGISGTSVRPIAAQKPARAVIGLRKNGTKFPVEASTSVLEFRGERLYTAILRDVTERYEAEQALQCANDQLEARVSQRTAQLASANKRLEKEVQEREQAEKKLQHLTGRLLQLQDEERRRFGRELHDSTSQYLASLALNISVARSKQNSSELSDVLADCIQLVEGCSAEIRTISYLLHPPILDDLGLESALKWYAEGFSKRSGITTVVDSCPGLGRLPADVERALFRIVQEALTNVRKHSGARNTRVVVGIIDNQVCLEVLDDGHGFDTDSGIRPSAALGVGIAGMQERVRQLGGQLSINSSPLGTAVKATLPLTCESPLNPTAQIAGHDLRPSYTSETQTS